jgi:FkbM family methyltransferase
MNVDLSQADAEDRVVEAFRAHWHGSDTSILVPRDELSSVRIESEHSALYIEATIQAKGVHEEDFHAFSGISQPRGIILDIGANWGYSVASLWSVAPECKVVSFEPIIAYQSTFAKIKALFPHLYDYFMVGLGSSTADVMFTVPVVNGIALSALNTARVPPEATLRSLVSNIFLYARTYMPDSECLEVRLMEFTAEIRTLDSIVQSNPGIFANYDVVGMKIDVEGLEADVLYGARDLLRQSAPLIMLEQGNRYAGLGDWLSGFGYSYAERKDGRLVPVSGMTSASNGFFLHEKHKRMLAASLGK